MGVHAGSWGPAGSGSSACPEEEFRTYCAFSRTPGFRLRVESLAGGGAHRRGSRSTAGPELTTIRAAWDAWHEGAKAGTVRDRSGERFKRRRSAPTRGRCGSGIRRVRRTRLGEVQRPDLQRFIYKLDAAGLGASTIRGTLLPVRAIYRRASSLGEVAVNPSSVSSSLSSAAAAARASPAEAETLIAALRDDHDRALWGTLVYAGVRLGEAQALRWMTST